MHRIEQKHFLIFSPSYLESDGGIKKEKGRPGDRIERRNIIARYLRDDFSITLKAREIVQKLAETGIRVTASLIWSDIRI